MEGSGLWLHCSASRLSSRQQFLASTTFKEVRYASILRHWLRLRGDGTGNARRANVGYRQVPQREVIHTKTATPQARQVPTRPFDVRRRCADCTDIGRRGSRCGGYSRFTRPRDPNGSSRALQPLAAAQTGGCEMIEGLVLSLTSLGCLCGGKALLFLAHRKVSILRRVGAPSDAERVWCIAKFFGIVICAAALPLMIPVFNSPHIYGSP